MQKQYVKSALAASMLALMASPTIAADTAHALGTSAAKVASATHRGSVSPTIYRAQGDHPLVFTNASYMGAGVGMRNHQFSAITITGAPSPVQHAYLYFTILYSSTPPSTQLVMVKNLDTGVEKRSVKAVLIATGGDPCWESSGNAVYRATVPVAVASGNGVYEIGLSADASATDSGVDPWSTTPTFPAAEGASLVLVGPGASTVVLYDVVNPAGTTFLSGTTFFAGLNYVLGLPTAASGGYVRWDSIGADGQIGSAVTPQGGQGEVTTINGVGISGPGAADPTSDWDGNAGLPQVQLWDHNAHDITTAVPAGTTSLNVAISAAEDCVATVANVIEY